MSWLGKKFNTPVGMLECVQLGAVKKLSFRAFPRFKDVYTDDIGFCSTTNGSFLRCRRVGGMREWAEVVESAELGWSVWYGGADDWDAGVVVFYGINSFANMLANSEEFRNDPRNPNAKTPKPADKH
ncbi:F-type H+-transporting ATPase subunit J protein [Rutstroemia sp. NJR-2017a WRK4]|nr:F-type H+-transporting ATPase subunit J protein [Rutstroemia sp. NJR-2017a WRK4]